MFLLSVVLLAILKFRFSKNESICQIINRRYGPHCVRKFRALEQQEKKLRKAELDVKFLTACKAYNIIPNFLQIRVYRKSLRNGQPYREFQNTLLDGELNTRRKDIIRLTQQNKAIRTDLKAIVSCIDFLGLQHFISLNLNKFVQSVSSTHSRKLSSLGGRLNLQSCDPHKVIFNFSNKELSSREKFLLSFGLHFNLPVFKPSFFKHFLSIENLIHLISKLDINPNMEFQTIKRNISSKAMSFFYGFKRNVFSPIFTQQDYNILKLLGKDDNITICTPDKGKGVVIFNKCDYISKMNAILSDSSKFLKVPHEDPFLITVRLEDRINRMLAKLKELGTISYDLYNQLYASGSSPGILYGTAKIHKPNVPLRPILAAYNTSMYKLGKFLVKMLESLATNQYSLKNSYAFYNDITKFTANGPLFMVSYDISSLYTNVPVHQTIDILTENIFQSQNLFHGFNKKQLIDFLKITASDTYFFFNKTLYKQIEGLSMGNPCAPTLANIFLCYIEERMFGQCPDDIKPLFYKRYLDDTFVVFQSEAQAERFHSYINTIHANIQFTMEKEVNNKLPFLDMTVERLNNKFSTNIYRKPTFTGLGLSFFSFLPYAYKVTAIKSLIYRAYHLSSSLLAFHVELKFLSDYFFNNGYPKKLFDVCVGKFINSIYVRDNLIYNVPKQLIYVSLPYFGTKSELLASDLKSILNLSYPQIEFKFAFNSTHKIGSFFKFKDRIPASLCSNIVYKYKCNSCQEFYIGSTTKQSKIRFCQHLSISPRTNNPLISSPHSTPREHAYNNSHPFRLDDFKIIDHARNERELRILESLHIFKQSPTLNIDKSAVPLNVFA